LAASLEKAIEFVAQDGNAVEQARLRYALTGAQPHAEAIAALFSNQRADGSFSPFWAPNYSSLDTTC
jgi:hypothetical protein